MKESSSKHLRQAIAQQAARMMAEEGVVDYSRAKRKAARQLGVAEDDRCLPSNAEVESALRVHHEIFHSDEQPQLLHQLRSEALSIMQLLAQFNPHLAGSVLDGTAGRFAETQIHLFVDSLKDVELFLLKHNIPYQVEEKSSRFGHEKRLLPVFVLEGRSGVVRLVVFDTDDLRSLPRTLPNDGVPLRAPLLSVAAMVEQA
jgi:hypothetical protein